jgi:hypothetical protein
MYPFVFDSGIVVESSDFLFLELDLTPGICEAVEIVLQ